MDKQVAYLDALIEVRDLFESQLHYHKAGLHFMRGYTDYLYGMYFHYRDQK